MLCNHDATHWIGVIKDIVSIIVSVATIIIISIGLSKWRSEFTGKRYYEVTFKLLKSVYNLRDQFLSLRSSYTSPGEMLQDTKIENYQKANNYFVMNNRLKSFNEALNEYRSILPEVEALPEVGKNLRNICSGLDREVLKYRFRLNEYLQLFDNTNNFEYLSNLAKTVYYQSEDDVIAKEFGRIILELEEKISKSK